MTASALSLSLEQTQRYARQIALPEIGVAGQVRLAESTIALVPGGSASDSEPDVRPAPVADPAGDMAALLLAAAGVGRIVRIPPPGGGAEAWLPALRGSSAVMRFSFEDDPLLRAAVRLGLPAVFGRARVDRVDVVSFRRHGPCPHLPVDLPTRGAAGTDVHPGAAVAVIAALVATELVGILAAPGTGPRARLLRLRLGPGGDGEPPLASEIPWAPECFICGGKSQEALLTGEGP
jgi:hypothetical protein